MLAVGVRDAREHLLWAVPLLAVERARAVLGVLLRRVQLEPALALRGAARAPHEAHKRAGRAAETRQCHRVRVIVFALAGSSWCEEAGLDASCGVASGKAGLGEPEHVVRRELFDAFVLEVVVVDGDAAFARLFAVEVVVRDAVPGAEVEAVDGDAVAAGEGEPDGEVAARGERAHIPGDVVGKLRVKGEEARLGVLAPKLEVELDPHLRLHLHDANLVPFAVPRVHGVDESERRPLPNVLLIPARGGEVEANDGVVGVDLLPEVVLVEHAARADDGAAAVHTVREHVAPGCEQEHVTCDGHREGVRPTRRFGVGGVADREVGELAQVRSVEDVRPGETRAHPERHLHPFLAALTREESRALARAAAAEAVAPAPAGARGVVARVPPHVRGAHARGVLRREPEWSEQPLALIPRNQGVKLPERRHFGLVDVRRGREARLAVAEHRRPRRLERVGARRAHASRSRRSCGHGRR
mmetsp:Transcript_29264/g.95364  ORF Transcript_29264/g.95364 Transcript_29264/m.95364 type:complete len:472 (-) Transcript_29264:112-1527(-)